MLGEGGETRAEGESSRFEAERGRKVSGCTSREVCVEGSVRRPEEFRACRVVKSGETK
jgi:hypothetical protein